MSSAKRKFSNLGLQRRVRLRVEPEPGSDVGLSDRSSSEAPSEDTVEHSGSEDHSGDGNKLSGSEVVSSPYTNQFITTVPKIGLRN